MILMQLIMKHAKSENRMQIIGNPARFRYYKLVLREIGGKSMPKFRFQNCLRNTCLHARKIFNLPPFCFVCLSFDITRMLRYCNFTKITKRSWQWSVVPGCYCRCSCPIRVVYLGVACLNFLVELLFILPHLLLSLPSIPFLNKE